MIFEEKTLNTETIYKGKIITVLKKEVTVKSGRTSSREIVLHNGAVSILAITEENKIVLVKQFRKAIDEIVIEIPAGKIEEGEEPVITAMRELREETGYRAENLEFLQKFYPSLGYSNETIYIYLAKGLTLGDTNFDDDEDIELLEIDIKEALKMVETGEIVDGKTIIALLHAKGMLNI